MTPSLRIINRQRAIRVNLTLVNDIARAALPQCMRAAKHAAPLRTLPVIEATLLSDARIAALHDEFFFDPSPTDVITFLHGEILVGTPTAARNAGAFGHSIEGEVALCIIHGLLHLGGWKDSSLKEKEAMTRVQEKIFCSAMAQIPRSSRS